MSGVSNAAIRRDELGRNLAALSRRVRALETARRGEAMSIGRGGIRVQGGRILAEDSSGEDVFQVTTEPPTIFMRPELISEIARLVIADVIFTDIVGSFEQTSSTTYTDLDTVGPEIANIEISDAGKMLVMISAETTVGVDTSTGQLNEFGWMGYDLVGPTSRSPTDSDALLAGFGADPSTGTIAAGPFSAGTKVSQEFGLEPGNYTITAKYRAEATLGGTPSPGWRFRRLTVIAF